MAPFGQINACGGDYGNHWFCLQFSTLTNHSIKCYYFSIPTFHYSIIPVWNMQNGWLGIPYYQQFVEFPIHLITWWVDVIKANNADEFYDIIKIGQGTTQKLLKYQVKAKFFIG
jgi:hypothetical protein